MGRTRPERCALVVLQARRRSRWPFFFLLPCFSAWGMLWSSLTWAAKSVLDDCVDGGACGDVSKFSLQHQSCDHDGRTPACVACELRSRSAFAATPAVLHDSWTCGGPRTTDRHLWYDSGVTLMERPSMTVTQGATCKHTTTRTFAHLYKRAQMHTSHPQPTKTRPVPLPVHGTGPQQLTFSRFRRPPGPCAASSHRRRSRHHCPNATTSCPQPCACVLSHGPRVHPPVRAA